MSVRSFWDDNDYWLVPITVITSIFILIFIFTFFCIRYAEKNTIRMIELCENHGFASHGYICENGVLIERESDE